jgi:hypothetical protein
MAVLIGWRLALIVYLQCCLFGITITVEAKRKNTKYEIGTGEW